MGRLMHDLRYGFRGLTKKPVFTVIAVASLAIGIGANTAIFSLVNAIIIQDLPAENPEELVELYKRLDGFSHATMAFPDLADLERETGAVFSAVTGTRFAFVQTDIEGGVEVVPAELVTGNYFTMQGVDAHLGRTLLPEDDVAPGAHPVAMLGYGYWQRRFGGDSSVVGQEMRLNGRLYTVIGVAHREYSGMLRGLTPGIYVSRMMVAHLQPSTQDELNHRGNQSVFAKARLAPGVSIVQAQQVLDELTRSLQDLHPTYWESDNAFVMVPTEDVIMNPMVDRVLVPAAGFMMAVMAMVLLIASANLASFLLAQAADRRREIAIRLALGAKRATLIRQLLTESMMLALLGGTAGIMVASYLLKLLTTADLPLPIPITLDLSLDATVLGFSLIVTLAAGLFFGLVPAIQATNPDVAPTLKDESAGGGRAARGKIRNTLVVAQVAVSLVLLISAGLFLRSLQARVAVDPGFGYDPAGIVLIQTPTDRYTPVRARAFYRSLIEQAGSLPGVTAVGMTADLHLDVMNNMWINVNVDGVAPPVDRDAHSVDWAQVDPGFFEAVGVQIVRGRGFDSRDGTDGAPVAIINETMAARFWPNEDPIGRVIREDDVDRTVVGVAHDTKVRSLGESPRPFLYAPFAQNFTSSMTLVAKTTGNAGETATSLIRIARELDPEILIAGAKTMERHLAVMLLPHRLSALVVVAFGTLALLLASIGLSGVVSYAVSTRSREMGIRMSLGAEPNRIVRMLLGDGMKLVVIGALIGTVLSALAAQLLGRLLYGVETIDPATFGLVPLLLIGVSFLSAWIPARRASKLDPVEVLRAE